MTVQYACVYMVFYNLMTCILRSALRRLRLFEILMLTVNVIGIISIMCHRKFYHCNSLRFYFFMIRSVFHEGVYDII